MARRIYISNGTARRARTLYIGVNNAARRVTAAYIGVGGSARKIYPATHTWNRYYVVYDYQYNAYVSSDTTVDYRYNAVFGQYSLIQSYSTYVYDNLLYFNLPRGDQRPIRPE